MVAELIEDIKKMHCGNKIIKKFPYSKTFNVGYGYRKLQNVLHTMPINCFQTQYIKLYNISAKN